MLIVLILAAAVGRAQEADRAQALTFLPLVDKQFGFDLNVPAGWSYDRSAFFGPGGARGVLRGATPDGRNTLQVLIFEDEQSDFAAWTEFFGRQLAAISGIEAVRVEPLPQAPRPTAIVDAPAVVGAERTRTLYYCTRFDEDRIWVLAYSAVVGRRLPGEGAAGPTDGPLEVPPLLRVMTDSLRVRYDPQVAAEVQAALKRGRAYLERFQLQNDIRELRVDEKPRVYLIRISGKPTGYLSRRFLQDVEPIEKAAHGARPREGLRVRERWWQFSENGGAQYTRVELFSRIDGHTDLYEFNETIIPSPGDADAKTIRVRDQCVREADALFSSVTTSEDRDLPDPREPIRLDDAYLGLAWVRVLPGLIGTEAGDALAFTIYDDATRALVTHSIRPLGMRPLPGGGRTAAAYELREGVLPEAAMLYTDEFGHMLRLEAGEMLVELADEATIEGLFRAKRDEALRRSGY